MLHIQTAKSIAREWVKAEAARLPGFQGAFFHGSVNWLPDDARLPPGSDLDVMVVTDRPSPVKLGKFVYRDVLLEISYISWADLQSAAYVLGRFFLAGSFHRASVIADPTGRLAPLQAEVAAQYAARRWVRTRCDHATAKLLSFLDALEPAAPLYQQAMAWVFGASCLCLPPLLAALENPTVRRRYVAARDVLTAYGHADFYAALLEQLGARTLSPATVTAWLHPLAAAFDAAGRVIRSPLPFAADLSAAARPVAIDGSRTLIDDGLHREAVFWMVVTYCRCLMVLDQDGPAHLYTRFLPGLVQMLADLGINAPEDFQRRSAEVRRLLPELQQVTAAILVANPHVRDDPAAGHDV